MNFENARSLIIVIMGVVIIWLSLSNLKLNHDLDAYKMPAGELSASLPISNGGSGVTEFLAPGKKGMCLHSEDANKGVYRWRKCTPN